MLYSCTIIFGGNFVVVVIIFFWREMIKMSLCACRGMSVPAGEAADYDGQPDMSGHPEGGQD